MRLIGCGDSWAWGAELINPELEPKWVPGTDNHNLHYVPHHEEYRLKHRYLNVFAEKANASELVDLSMAGFSNDAIVRTLNDWLINEGYLNGRDTSELFISIGWSSPERKEFYYKDRWYADNWMQLGPMWVEDSDVYERSSEVGQFAKLYVKNFWNAGEYMHRWIHQIWNMQILFERLNIKYVMHQAFYHHYGKMVNDWEDEVYHKNHADHITHSDKELWKYIDPIRFMHKNDPAVNTAHAYMLKQADNRPSKVFAEMHPNALGHKIWGDYMYHYCIENNLL